MTDDVRNLIRFVVDGDIRNAQTQCRIMLEKNVPEKDARFKENELRKLNLLKPELIHYGTPRAGYTGVVRTRFSIISEPRSCFTFFPALMSGSMLKS